MTRARIQWLNEGEKPTSFFCKLENKNFTEKNNEKASDRFWHYIDWPKSILKEIHKFYAKLFKSRDCQAQNDVIQENIAHANLKQVPEIKLGNDHSVFKIGKALKNEE